MNSRTWGFAVSSMASLAVWLSTGLASAQPATAPVEPPPPAEPTPPPGPPAVAAMPMPAEQPDTGRPTGMAIAIGFGYSFPTSLQTPNITSVRLRLASGLTFEPLLVLATSSNDIDTGMTVTNKQSELTLGSLVHVPLRAHRKVDFELLGDAFVSSQTTDPNGDSNNLTNITFTLGYGLGLAYWVTPHWNLSLSATNPLVSYSRTRQDTGAGADNVNTITTFGLVFSPRVALMLHLYN
jgi:hypothetical protein